MVEGARIAVRIFGVKGSGKSVIASVIAKALQKEGLTVDPVSVILEDEEQEEKVNQLIDGGVELTIQESTQSPAMMGILLKHGV